MTADLMCEEHVQSHYSDAGVGGLVHLQPVRFHYWTSAVHLLRVNNSFNIWRLVDLFLGGGKISLCSWPETCDPPASTSHKQRLLVYVTMTSHTIKYPA